MQLIKYLNAMHYWAFARQVFHQKHIFSVQSIILFIDLLSAICKSKHAHFLMSLASNCKINNNNNDSPLVSLFP